MENPAKETFSNAVLDISAIHAKRAAIAAKKRRARGIPKARRVIYVAPRFKAF
jgi:hypothetical protein